MRQRRSGLDQASDDALLAGLGVGDQRCGAAFVRRFESRVFGLALAIVHDRALAEDVAQEAFTRAWRHAAAFDPRRGQVSTWLLTITRNLAIDALRLNRPTPIDPETVIAAVGGGLGTGPEDAAVADDAHVQVRAALRALSPIQQRAVLLAAFGGRTAQEVADHERIPLGTAKTRIRDGLIRLRAELASAEVAP